MTKAAKNAVEPKVSRSLETSAPTTELPGANETVGNSTPERITTGQSPRKPRLMNILLDKLWEQPKPVQASERRLVGVLMDTETDSDFDNDFDAVNDTEKPSTSSASQPEGRNDDPWIGETQIGEISTRSMTFTYPPGSTPLPRYTIRRGVGIGGFGEVYFAVSDVGKEVALKRIQRNLEIELRGVSQCLNLKHPNLVALFDICRDSNDQSWVVMEYVAGLNLRQILDESPNGLPPVEVNRWIQGIGAGVHHLHTAGLVHRDLKPGNIFDDLGLVKVGDYGLSKFISSSHRGGHTESVGTFHYMAPEIGRGQYGREIDIYALGILLFELLTGQVPFDGESCHEIIVKHLTATPDLGGVAEPYRSTIARCLEKDPGKRFESVADMLATLPLGVADAGVPSSARQSSHEVSCEEFEPINAILVANNVDPVSTNRLGLEGVQSPTFVDEPVARAAQSSWHELSRWWSGGSQTPESKTAHQFDKWILLLVAGFLILANWVWLVPMLTLVACVYVPYYIIRQMVLHSRRQPSYAEAQRIATVVAPQRQAISPSAWRNGVRNELRAKPTLHRLAELNTSWIAAMVSVAGLTLVAGVIGLDNVPVFASSIAPYAWLAVIVLSATCGILGLGKLWECDEGESLPRRLVLAGVGAGVGFLAYTAGGFLMIPLDQGLIRDIPSSFSMNLYSGDGPHATAFMAHFALLFVCLRWWKPVDPLRRKRLSLWSVAVAVAAGWAVHQVLPITGAIGMWSAGGIAIAVQLSAPWVNSRTSQRNLSQPQQATGDVVNAAQAGAYDA
jgi:serine/threonine protein kinase